MHCPSFDDLHGDRLGDFDVDVERLTKMPHRPPVQRDYPSRRTLGRWPGPGDEDDQWLQSQTFLRDQRLLSTRCEPSFDHEVEDDRGNLTDGDRCARPVVAVERGEDRERHSVMQKMP